MAEIGPSEPTARKVRDARTPWARIKTPADLGRFLRRRRLDHNLSQQEVADLLGFHRNYLQEIEAGKDIIAFRRLFDLARELGVEIRVQAKPSRLPDTRD